VSGTPEVLVAGETLVDLIPASRGRPRDRDVPALPTRTAVVEFLDAAEPPG